MLALPLAMVLAVAPFHADYEMRLRDVPVGYVRLEHVRSHDGWQLRYRSESLVRRGPVLTRLETRVDALLDAASRIRRLVAHREEGGTIASSLKAARVEGALRIESRAAGGAPVMRLDDDLPVPSALAPLLLAEPERRCVSVIEESTGRIGEACGRSFGERVDGTLLGEPFEARVTGGRLTGLSFPRQGAAFQLVSERVALPAPPDLFGTALTPVGPVGRAAREARFELRLDGRPALPESASQSVRPSETGIRIHWRQSRPLVLQPLGKTHSQGQALDSLAGEGARGARERWAAAAALARFVSERVVDKRPAAEERSPLVVAESGRASCRGHVELFLALARAIGLPARRAVGLALEDGRFWGHAWAQVEVGGRWYDVDPTSGEAPPASPSLFLASPGTAEEELDAGRLLMRALNAQVRALGAAERPGAHEAP